MATTKKAPAAAPLANPELDPAVADELLANVDAIARRMVRQVADVGGLPPEFRRVGYLRDVTRACRDALGTLVRLLRDGRGLRPGDLDRLGSMGAHQAELGVPLELLLSAYRLAAKVVWREVIGEATRVHELPPATVITVTESVLEYLDEISAAVGAAYLQTRERLMRERDRTRDRVLERLVAGDTSAELRQLAVTAGVKLAPPYRVVAYDAADESQRVAVETLWAGQSAHIVAEPPSGWIVLLPENIDVEQVIKDHRRLRPAATLDNTHIGVGPVAASLEDIHDAVVRARAAQSMGVRLEPERTVHHDAELAIFTALASDPEGLRRFAQTVLGDLAIDNAPRRVRLRQTLAAVLATSNVAAAARALRIHRHTAMYRLQALRDMGINPDAPGQRPRLWLALQALRLQES